MSIHTLRVLLAAGIGLVLAQGARATDPAASATDDGTQAVAQPVASDGDGQSAQAAASDNDAQTAVSTIQGDGTRAADSCEAPSKDCVAVGHWNFDVSLGAGVRTDPVVHGADIPLVVVPHFSYYGKRVFIEDLDFGVTVMESVASTVSLIASPGYDRVFFYRSDLQNIFVSGIPSLVSGAPQTERFPARPRHWTYLAGPEWTFKTHGITGQLDLLHEITAQNHGNEVRAALGIPLIESTGSLSANVGLTWKSAAIVNYYYGAPGVYEGGWALNPFVKLGYSRPLSSKWRLTAFVHYEHLGNAIADSPIVNAHYVVTVFAGANYAF
jgi:outer membrane protein